ncbi:MAG: FAD-binding oxidoreductase [Paracoccaceae bacterium]|nr:FAD-binding oxidoreductase [Paracoccaceae bacterium]
MAKTTDILIIGGAVIGSSVAWWLSREAGLKITVIERDPTYQQASTALSAASIRLQFSNPLNVAISRFGADFIRDFSSLFPEADSAHDLAFKENGYLFLAGNKEQADILRRNHATQLAQGAETVLLAPDEVKARYPFLNCDDIVLAALGRRHEGWFDNMGLLSGLKKLARRNGVEYLQGEVVDLVMEGRRIRRAVLRDGRVLDAGIFINAAGPRGGQVAAMAGVEIPVAPRKRTTFVFQTPERPSPDAPLVSDFQGVYFRPEGEFWMGAVQPEQDQDTAFDDFDPDYAQFEQMLWPRLAQRAQIFEAIRMKRAWAGHYAFNRFDQNAIIGRHPQVDNMILANGFSGHGLQQAPAIGRGIAELVVHGHYTSLDLSPLGTERIIEGQPYLEENVI